MTKLIPVKYENCAVFYNPDTKKFEAVVIVQIEEGEHNYYDLVEK